MAGWQGTGRPRIAAPPVQVAHLGLEPIFLNRARMPAAVPYFVHVGTLEGRKNLAFLLSVWRRLDERMGAAAPRLALAYGLQGALGQHGGDGAGLLVIESLQQGGRQREGRNIKHGVDCKSRPLPQPFCIKTIK